VEAIHSIALKVFGEAFVPEWHFYDGGSEERETCRAKSALKVFGEAFYKKLRKERTKLENTRKNNRAIV
jgi:hypothetical protein